MAFRRRYGNSILQSLPLNELKSPDLKKIELAAGTRLCQPGRRDSEIYFPIDCVISFIGDTDEGESIEVWAAGNEGAAGISAMFSDGKPFRAVVQIPGQAIVSNAAVLQRHFKKCSAFHDRLLAYYNYLLV